MPNCVLLSLLLMTTEPAAALGSAWIVIGLTRSAIDRAVRISRAGWL